MITLNLVEAVRTLDEGGMFLSSLRVIKQGEDRSTLTFVRSGTRYRLTVPNSKADIPKGQTLLLGLSDHEPLEQLEDLVRHRIQARRLRWTLGGLKKNGTQTLTVYDPRASKVQGTFEIKTDCPYEMALAFLTAYRDALVLERRLSGFQEEVPE